MYVDYTDIINVAGFYRVNYDPANWLKIADYLDSENYSRVHVLNRAQLVNDAVHLMLADKLDPEIFMSLTRYLRRETDCTVWYTLFLILKESFKVFKALTYNDGDTLLKVSLYTAVYYKIFIFTSLIINFYEFYNLSN